MLESQKALNWTMDVPFKATFNLSVDILKCRNVDSCLLDVVLLATQEEWDEFQNGTLNYNQLSGTGIFLNVPSVEPTTFTLNTGAYLIIFNPSSDSIDLELEIAFSPLPSCFVEIISAIGTSGFILICVGFICYYRDKQKHHKPQQEEQVVVVIPIEQLADPSYFETTFPWKLKCLPKITILEKVLTQPQTKYSYWFKQQWRFTAPWYPEHDEVLSKSE